MSGLSNILPGGTLGRICTEALSALSAETARSSRDIFEDCQSAESVRDLSKAIYWLRQRGLVTEAGMAPPPDGVGSRTGKLYVLSEQAVDLRLAEHLERELVEAPALSDQERELAESMDAERPDALESAPEPHVISDWLPPGKSAEGSPRGCFIARHIAALEEPEPRVLEAGQWAAIVGAIADRLDAGRALPPDADVIAALREMQQGLIEVST